MIKLSVTKVNIPDLKMVFNSLKTYVSKYIYDNVDSVAKSFIQREIVSYIYGRSGVTRRTGDLGKAMEYSKSRLNQYSNLIRVGWNERKVAYINTHVGTGKQTIGVKNVEWLTIPFKGGPADRYPRVSLWNFANTFAKRGNSGRPIFYQKRGQSVVGLYHGRKNVSVRRRIDPDEIGYDLEQMLDVELPFIADRAVNSFIRKGFTKQ